MFVVVCKLLFPSNTHMADTAKSQMIALILSILLGGLGIDRFYLGKYGTGFLKLITGGGFGIWWLVDIILIATGKMTDGQGRPLAK